MPTYQYVCTECGSDLEAVQSFSDPSLTDCPTCGGKLRKRFGAVGVVFKGSGFYRNDSRSDASRGSGERKSDGDATGGDASSKTETKAESKDSSSASKDSTSDGAKPKSSDSTSSNSSTSTAKTSSAA